MMHDRNSACGMLQRIFIAAAIALVLITTPAARGILAGDGDPPAPAETMRAYRTLDTWIRGWKMPESAPQGLPPCCGAGVLLRLDGAILGKGSSVSVLPRSDHLWVATRRAMAEAESRIPTAEDLLQEEARRDVLARLTVSIELAGALTPMQAETYTAAEQELSPGLDGVAVVMGQGADASVQVVFPGTMLLTGMLPHRAMGACASMLGGASVAALEPLELRKSHSMVAMRFRVTHLAQVKAGEEPRFLERGQRVIEVSEINEATLRAMAGDIASFLVRGAAGETSGDGKSTWRPDERLLAMVALKRYGESVRPLDAGQMRLVQALSASGSGLGKDDAGVATAVIAALRSMGPDGSTTPGLVAAMQRVFSSENGFAQGVPASVYGVLALGITNAAAGASAVEGAPLKSMASAAVRQAFVAVPEGQMVSQMPWLGWAELRLASLEQGMKGGNGQEAVGDVPSAIALRRMREQLWQHQVAPAALGSDTQDLAGGIVFTATKSPFPTWQGARPLAFLATMLGDPKLTEAPERQVELVRLLSAIRYLRQLQIGDHSAWVSTESEGAMGGIRAAMWDSRQPVEASAFALMVVCETLDSLQKLRTLNAAGMSR